MKIGYACIPLGVNFSTNRRFMLKNFDQKTFTSTTKSNILDLMSILKYNLDNNILLFRISSDIIPFGSHEINKIDWQSIFKDELISIGKFIKENKIRVSMHPGQYTVLNSPSENIVNNAIRDIEYHDSFLNALEVDYSCKIILHIGGAYNNKADAIERFKLNFRRLSESAKKRLVIENDEKIFTILDVLNISKSIGIPVIFDNLHHELNPSFSNNIEDILREVKATWGELDGPMKLHYSNKAHNKKAGAHSEFVSSKSFLEFYKKVNSFNPDIMLEVKDKDLSAIKCLHCINPFNVDINLVWKRYKHTVMERSLELYEKAYMSVLDNNVTQLYSAIDDSLYLTIRDDLQIKVLEQICSDIKEIISTKENTLLIDYINSFEVIRAKRLVNRLAEKYKIDFLMDIYYFIY